MLKPLISTYYGIRKIGGITSFFNLKETDMSQVAQAKKNTITLELQVSDPVELAPGVFKTTLSHSSLDGDLTLVHNSNGREAALQNLSSGSEEVNLVEAIGKIAKVAQEAGLFKGLGNKPKQ